MDLPPAYEEVAVANSTKVNLTINGKNYVVDPTVDTTVTPSTTLAEFIRSHTPKTSTKIFCHQGGCGACTVALSYLDQTTNKSVTRSAHACLRPLFACNGMAVTTNDGLGDAKKGYNVIQQALADHNGSQCGYCSNGFVMAMHALKEQAAADGVKLTELDIENEFDGNLCRCTGYRPILDAMKTFADATEDHKECKEDDCRKIGCKRRGVFKDIEDMEDHIPKSTREYNPPKTKLHPKAGVPHKFAINSSGHIWQDCPTVKDLNYWLPWYKQQGLPVFLAVAQTSLGIYPENPAVRLNIGDIAELKVISAGTNGISVGPSAAITDLIKFAESYSASNASDPKAAHLPQMVKHLKRVASVMIRNVASVMGNICVSLQHQSENDFFCSDIATLLSGLGAQVLLFNPATNQTEGPYQIPDLYTVDMKYKYATSITIPWAATGEKFMSYKIAIRQVNSHALVNASMRATVTASGTIANPVLVLGGIWPRPTRVTATEKAITGMKVNDVTAFRTVASTFFNELQPAAFTGRQLFRKNTAMNYLYKFFLFLQTTPLPADLQTAADCWMSRGVSSGSQFWQPDPAEFPVSKGTPKVEAIQQTSGHAIYTGDIPVAPDTVYARLVLAEQGNCTLDNIDTSVAEQMPGFVAFLSAKDFPDQSMNAWSSGEIFATSNIAYYGQPVGVVVATTEQFAMEAAKKVIVNKKDIKPSVVDIKTAVQAGDLFPEAPPPVTRGNAKAAIASAPKKITDFVELGYQYHYHMENHTTYVQPREDVLEVHCATQMPVGVQGQIATTTGLPQSKIVVSTKRCGGGYGGKITNSLLGAGVAGFVSKQLDLPCKLIIDLDQTSATLGNRGGKYMTYEVGVDENGKILGMEAVVNCAAGTTFGGEMGAAFVSIRNLDNAYYIPNVDFKSTLVKMNIPSTTAVRGPGWIPAIHLMESVISRIALEVNLPPEQIRETNFFKKGETTADGMVLRYWDMQNIWQQLKDSAQWTARQAEVKAFNQKNRWVKRGLGMTPARFGVGQAGADFGSVVNIYPDGTIGVTIGGCEIGQGLNTKVMQVVAYKLGLPDVSKITINETCTRSLSGASNVTGGSITSAMCSLSVMHACEELNRRLMPFRSADNNTWEKLIAAASTATVDLTAQGWSNAPPMGSGAFNYNSNSAALTEVEVDVLTGEYEVRRVDIVFDCGISLNPMIDVGQVEGGFVFGMGYFIQEECAWDPATGKPLNGDTWEYKIASAFDVPEVFNCTLLKNAPNPLGVLGSKASGEPGVALGTSAVRALEAAVSAAREDAGESAWVCRTTPLTVDKVQQACATTPSQFVL